MLLSPLTSASGERLLWYDPALRGEAKGGSLKSSRGHGTVGETISMTAHSTFSAIFLPAQGSYGRNHIRYFNVTVYCQICSSGRNIARHFSVKLLRSHAGRSHTGVGSSYMGIVMRVKEPIVSESVYLWGSILNGNNIYALSTILV